MSIVGWPGQVARFLREVRTEGRKVSWPERPQVVQGSIAVLVFVVVTSAFLGLSDFAIGWLIDKLLS